MRTKEEIKERIKLYECFIKENKCKYKYNDDLDNHVLCELKWVLGSDYIKKDSIIERIIKFFKIN